MCNFSYVLGMQSSGHVPDAGPKLRPSMFLPGPNPMLPGSGEAIELEKVKVMVLDRYQPGSIPGSPDSVLSSGLDFTKMYAL